MRTCFIILFFLVFFQSCEIFYCGDYEYIPFINNSDDTIIVLSSKSFPDTLLPKSLFDYALDNFVCPKQYAYNLIEITDIQKSDTIIFFVITENIFLSNSWNNIRENNLISARYILSCDELKKLNYRVSFPPNDKMVDMNIYFKKDTK